MYKNQYIVTVTDLYGRDRDFIFANYDMAGAFLGETDYISGIDKAILKIKRGSVHFSINTALDSLKDFIDFPG